jgi:hypothetical protein
MAGKSIVLDVYESTLISIESYPQFSDDGYIIAWNPLSARQDSDGNVLNTDSFQEWIMTYIPPLLKGASIRNSSPTIGDINVFYVCKDKFTTISLPVKDNDGDELKFRLSKPFGVYNHNNGIIDNVDLIWANGYSDSNQISGNPALGVDQDTGIITVKPDKTGQYFVGMTIEEYRDGKKIGAVNLYYTFIVVECKDSLDLDPKIYKDTISVKTVTICQGTGVTLASKQNFNDPQPEFRWTRNGKIIWGANSQSLTLSQEGEYQLLTTDIVGCPDAFDSEIVQVNIISSGVEMDSIPPVCSPGSQPIMLQATPSAALLQGREWWAIHSIRALRVRAGMKLNMRLMGRRLAPRRWRSERRS